MPRKQIVKAKRKYTKRVPAPPTLEYFVFNELNTGNLHFDMHSVDLDGKCFISGPYASVEAAVEQALLDHAPLSLHKSSAVPIDVFLRVKRVVVKSTIEIV